MSQLLLLLLAFGLPHAPSGPLLPATTVYRYVVPDASLIATLDAGSVARSWLKILDEAGKQPFVTQVPEVAKGYAMLRKMLDMRLAALTTRLGADPTKIVRFVTASMALKAVGLPQYLVVFGGPFPATLHVQVAKMLGLTTPISSGSFTTYLSGNPLTPGVAYTKGYIILGSEKLLRALPQMAKLKPLSSGLGRRMRRLHQKRVLAAVGFQPEPSLIAKIDRQLKGPLRPLVKGLQAAHLLVRYDGVVISLWSASGQIQQRYLKLLKGLGFFLKAVPAALSGTFKLIDGLLDAQDSRLPGILRRVLAQKASLLAYLKQRIGGGPVNSSVALSGQSVKLEASGRGAQVVALIVSWLMAVTMAY